MVNFREKCIELLKSRGVSLDSICECAQFLQSDYHQGLTKEDLLPAVLNVLNKREVQFSIMTAIELDRQAENHTLLDKDLEDILNRDEGLFGVDEVLAYGICNLYGSIALTNFGYIDKKKFGIIDDLNCHGKNSGICNTFIDDVVGAVAASAAAHYAHDTRSRSEE